MVIFEIHKNSKEPKIHKVEEDNWKVEMIRLCNELQIPCKSDNVLKQYKNMEWVLELRSEFRLIINKLINGEPTKETDRIFYSQNEYVEACNNLDGSGNYFVLGYKDDIEITSKGITKI